MPGAGHPRLAAGCAFPVVGGPVFAILLGMLAALVLQNKAPFRAGIAFTSKKVLQYAVILLGFGLNLSQIAQVGSKSLPIICSTITTSLVIAFVISRWFKMPCNISVLVGVGSSICGGSAIAATAPSSAPMTTRSPSPSRSSSFSTFWRRCSSPRWAAPWE